MHDNGRFPDVVLWQDNCLPVSSTAIVYDGQFPKVELFLNNKFNYDDERVLKGRSRRGEYLTIHRSICCSTNHRHVTHNYDRANDRPIEDESKIDDFELYTTSIILLDGFIGDCFIDEANPAIDRLIFESRDLCNLRHVFLSMSEEDPSALLFENNFVSIKYVRGFSQSINDQREDKRYSYAVVFDFEQSIALNESMHTWVNPIIGLLMVILSGDIVSDDIVFYSKGYGAEFRKALPITEQRIGHEPRIGDSPFFRRDLTNILPLVISSWMERPNTLCGASPLYPHARYRLNLSESRFSFAMRLAEAAYADVFAEDVCSSKGIPLNPNGRFDLDDAIYSPVKQKLKQVANGKSHPFAEKIRTLGERFDCEYRASGKRIDWDKCAIACKDFRNAEAHGTIVNGQPRSEHEKYFALEQMGLMFYELAVLDLFIAHDESLADARSRLLKSRQMDVSIADFWSR